MYMRKKKKKLFS